VGREAADFYAALTLFCHGLLDVGLGHLPFNPRPPLVPVPELEAVQEQGVLEDGDHVPEGADVIIIGGFILTMANGKNTIINMILTMTTDMRSSHCRSQPLRLAFQSFLRQRQGRCLTKHSQPRQGQTSLT
jgi:hypothetical protein